MKLGQLINELSKLDQSLPLKISCELGNIYAGQLHIYRGYYDQLALEYRTKFSTVADALEDCKAAVGKEFTGYKGGDFTMSEQTPVWISSQGECEGNKICKIVADEYEARIEFFHDDY